MQGKGEYQYSFFSLLIVKKYKYIDIKSDFFYKLEYTLYSTIGYMKKVYWYEVGQSRYKKALDSTLQKKDIYVSGSVFS